MRRVFVKNPVHVTLSKLLFNIPFDYDSENNYGIEVYDNCHDIDIDNLVFLNEYHKKYKILRISNLSFRNHKLFLDSWKSEDKVHTSIDGCRFHRLMECYDPEKEIPISKITNENICSIYSKDRWKIDEATSFSKDIYCYRSELMNSESFLRYIDLIANQINDNSENDIDKIVLVNKFIKENIKYDYECYYETLKHNKNSNYTIKNQIDGNHIGHYSQSLITRKKAVCSAISSFSTILLNHPLLNIETKYIINNSVIDDHAWNNVKIDGKWYTCDFTWTIFRKPVDELEYILIKSRCKNSNDKEDNDIYSNSDFSRKDIHSSLNKLKDVHIEIPNTKENTKVITKRRLI